MGSWVTLLVERDIVGHVRLRDLLVGKEGVAWRKFGVSWHEDRGHGRGVHPLVVIGVDAHLHLLRCERELAYVERFELVMRLEIRPPPHSTIYYMWQPLPMGHLKKRFVKIAHFLPKYLRENL